MDAAPAVGTCNAHECSAVAPSGRGGTLVAPGGSHSAGLGEPMMCRAVRRVSTQTTYPSGYRRVDSEYPCAALRPQWMMCRAGAAVHRVPRAERLPGSAPRPLRQPNDLRQMLSRASECHPLLPPESTTATPDTATHAHAHTHTHMHAHARTRARALAHTPVPTTTVRTTPMQRRRAVLHHCRS